METYRSRESDKFYSMPFSVEKRESLNYFDAGVNSNKFYIAELHKNPMGFRVYITYGRVGSEGSPYIYAFSTIYSAEDFFEDKINSKLRKGYVRVDIAKTSRGTQEAQRSVNLEKMGKYGVVKQSVSAKSGSNQLNPSVTEFVRKIYEEANQAVSLSVSGSVKISGAGPLGNMGVQGIAKGRALLSDLNGAIAAKNMRDIMMLSQEYYSYVPRVMPKNLRVDDSWVLKTPDRIQKEYDTLQLYEDALRMAEVMGVSTDIFAQYKALKSNIRPVDSTTFAYIEKKIAESHANNHHFKLKVVNAFEVEQLNAPKFDSSVGNVRKLFHGTRSANLPGILSTNLRLPKNLSSNVLTTGAMFGPGIYFASECTKSANYSFGSWVGRANKYATAYLFIVEVALGEVYKVQDAHYFTNPPRGYDSVMGCRGKHLINNEFIIYRENRQHLKYIVEVEKK